MRVHGLFNPHELESPAISDLGLRADNDSYFRAQEAMHTLGRSSLVALREAILRRKGAEGTDRATYLAMCALSSIKPTHHKRLLATNHPYAFPPDSYRLYLNSYHACSQDNIDVEGENPDYINRHASKYVGILHNHGQSLISIILQGGYTAQELRFATLPQACHIGTKTEDWTSLAAELRPYTRSYREGDIMAIHPDEIHALRLTEILPATRTVVLELPAIRAFSVTFSQTLQAKNIFYNKWGQA